MERKQGKQEYLEIQSELDRLGVSYFYSTIELSVLGHYLTSSLSSLQSCINSITDNTIAKSSCRKILDQAASAPEGYFWLRIVLNGLLNVDSFCTFYLFLYHSLPHPLMGFVAVCVRGLIPLIHCICIYAVMAFSP